MTPETEGDQGGKSGSDGKQDKGNQGSSEGTQQPPQTNQGAGAGQQQEQPFDQQRAMDTIRAQRESEKQLKDQLKTEKEAREKLESEKLSDVEKKDKRIEELEGKLSASTKAMQDANLRSAIADSKHQVASVADTAVLLRQAGIDFDDDHAPKKLDSKLEELLQEKPFLRGAQGGQPQGTADGGQGSGGGEPDMNAILRQRSSA